MYLKETKVLSVLSAPCENTWRMSTEFSNVLRSGEQQNCFKPSQPQRIISGLKETFIKRYTVERTNKAEQYRKNRVRKRRIGGRIYGMKYS